MYCVYLLINFNLKQLKQPYDFGSIDDEELLKFLAVLTESCALMLRSMKDIGYNFSVKTLWQHVPIIFDCCNILLEAPAFKIIEVMIYIHIYIYLLEACSNNENIVGHNKYL